MSADKDKQDKIEELYIQGSHVLQELGYAGATEVISRLVACGAAQVEQALNVHYEITDQDNEPLGCTLRGSVPGRGALHDN